MFTYYLNLALRSLKRSPVLTGLMVLAIGLGIGASMTMITVLHVMTDDPLPGRSTRLFTPHLDPLPLKFKGIDIAGSPNANLTWPDAMALLHAHKAVRQAAMAGGRCWYGRSRQICGRSMWMGAIPRQIFSPCSVCRSSTAAAGPQLMTRRVRM